MIENKTCLACGSLDMQSALDLGMQPLANSYKEFPSKHEDVSPLAVNVCKTCYHLQLSHSVNPAVIYKNYLYAAGTSKTLAEYSDWFANFCKEYLSQANSVLDIGCNDGTQLNYFKQIGFDTYGIDPAENLYNTSSINHNVICDFFGPDVVQKLQNNRYDIITAQNVFAHNPCPLEFLDTCKKLMHANTLLFIQTSQADMVLNNEFDTIYHEHVNFFNINSLHQLAKRAGINLIDVVKTPIHGNSYVFVLSISQQAEYKIKNAIAMEKSLLELKTYNNWRSTVEHNMSVLKNTVKDLQSQGYTLVGYGAAAKGNTLLNYAEIDLDFIVDDSPLKQNLYTPGRNIPITGVESIQALDAEDKVVFIPLAWNFFNEIQTRIKNARSNPNDIYLRYFPKVELSK